MMRFARLHLSLLLIECICTDFVDGGLVQAAWLELLCGLKKRRQRRCKTAFNSTSGFQQPQDRSKTFCTSTMDAS
jgi:hypothetical protein